MRKCKWCDSSDVHREKKFFKDGSAHIALTCNACNKHIQYINDNREKKAANSRQGVSENRATLIRRAGFNSFDAYKESSKYQDVVKMVLLKYKYKCRFCKEKACTIAYSEYTQGNISGKDLSGLHPMCKDCDYALRYGRHNKSRSQVIFKQLKLMKKCINRGYVIAD
jgi:hypothetical protein